ncbi:hypothetical protein B0H16DRAFT_1721630 [Mycena metata]|uniref:Uncharacterized protein n=1 Tax=Mycena metata TaxID=1033252 RepID=A0AAD7J859_9AGAR|nr:hypothetical protein B0H16DRAFT_1721630 [Mycena metata]
MSTRKVHGKRSFTGNHPLLPRPAMGSAAPVFVPKVPTYTFLKWSWHVGVVIGFVISYRAMSGYDRYWMGRTA